MCGIVGYIGNQKACPILYNGLLRLEYRGYDSAGISTIEKQGISTIKKKGRVKELENSNEFSNLNGTIGIAHTRWATHGKPSTENSHPHMDNSKTFSVVHNGIIENYLQLKDFLKEKGYYFYSETDTEVIPNLIHYFYSLENQSDSKRFLNATYKACKKLEGSFALEIICTDFPDRMITVRKDSPLVIGHSEKENYISSDIPAILSYTKKFYLLNNYEYCEIFHDKINFYDSNLMPIIKNENIITWDASSAEKDGYDDFMLKEIYEQPKSIRETIGSRFETESDLDELKFDSIYLNSLSGIYIVACGTAMHAGMAVRNIFETLCKIPTSIEPASEFRYRNPLINNKTLCIFISQSGETADTIAALKLAKQNGAKTIAISNVVGSSITREADYSLYTHAGPEIAVASTKAYTSQITLLSILAIHFSKILGNNLELCDAIKEEILSLPAKVEEVLKNDSVIKDFSKKIYNEKNMFFIGRGIDYSASLEGSLKLKEISYIHSEAYPAGELKHGPIALIENGTTVVSIVTNKNLSSKTLSNVQEVISRGAKTIIITNQELENKKFDLVISIPEISEFISPILSVIPMQLLAYYISKNKGLDVDKPRNLAKSVTVE